MIRDGGAERRFEVTAVDQSERWQIVERVEAEEAEELQRGAVLDRGANSGAATERLDEPPVVKGGEYA